MNWKKREKEIAALRAKHKGSKFKVAIPSLAIEQRAAPLGNNIHAIAIGKHALPKDAKIFPIAASHKQGYEMLTESMIKNDLKYMSGKKT